MPPPLDLSTYTKATSGRSGNAVYIGRSTSNKAYKLFSVTGGEYDREVRESTELVEDFHVLFQKGLGRLQVTLPGGQESIYRVMQMRKAVSGWKTYMLAKSGQIRSFCNVLSRHKWDSKILKNLEIMFRGASAHGMKDPQFLYDSLKSRVYFMDIHLGGVEGGGHCETMADEISALRQPGR